MTLMAIASHRSNSFLNVQKNKSISKSAAKSSERSSRHSQFITRTYDLHRKTTKRAPREKFINDCRQKAWDASRHADWVSKGFDTIVASHEKVHDEDRDLEAEIKTLETAVKAAKILPIFILAHGREQVRLRVILLQARKVRSFAVIVA